MNLSPEGATFLRLHEGFVDHWYLDPVAVPTIGIGFTWGSAAFRDWWAKNKPGVPFAKGAKMTREEADAALIYICAKEYGKAVNDFLAPHKVRQHVFDGMTSPVYNLGTGSLKWKWAAAVRNMDLREAADRLRNTGTTAKGKKLAGLVRRRKEEADLLQNGNYGSAAALTDLDPLADGVLVRGERGAAVADLQNKLAAMKFYVGTVDGIFGYGTEAAVLEFQRSKGLTADGFAGPKTLEALSVKPAPVTPPKPAEPVSTKPNSAGWIVLAATAVSGIVLAAWDWIVAVTGIVSPWW
jgi:GH24 family phage-related lysozyme (muramidase)